MGLPRLVALPACFHLADRVFPLVRQEAACRLVAAGWSQARAAAAVGVSQAMVSKYLAAPQTDDPLVLRLADELVSEAEAGTYVGNDTGAQTDATSSWCALLAPPGDGALADLLAAEHALLRAAPVALVPQIGLNIARAAPGAKDPADVLAYPIRFATDGTRIVRASTPAWGASGHLAQVLLAARQSHGAVHAVASLAGTSGVLKAAARAGLAVNPIERGDDTDPDRPVLAAAHRCHEVPALLHDPGAKGLEPSLYVVARDARETMRLALSINAKVTP